jgi:peptidoglycan hydrolase CwlO-like protein
MEIAKRLSNQNKSSTLTERELENSHKQNENLKKEVRLLQKKINSGSMEKMEELMNMIKSKNEEIAELQREIKTLKKVNTFQEKGLLESANEGLLTYMRENK